MSNSLVIEFILLFAIGIDSIYNIPTGVIPILIFFIIFGREIFLLRKMRELEKDHARATYEFMEYIRVLVYPEVFEPKLQEFAIEFQEACQKQTEWQADATMADSDTEKAKNNVALAKERFWKLHELVQLLGYRIPTKLAQFLPQKQTTK